MREVLLLWLGLFAHTSLGTSEGSAKDHGKVIDDFIDLDDPYAASLPGHHLTGLESKHKQPSLHRINNFIELGPTSSSPLPSPSSSSSAFPTSSTPLPSSSSSAAFTATRSTKISDVIFDDDDIFISGSGSGSGSGDFHSGSGAESYSDNGHFTPTTKSSPMTWSTRTSTVFASDTKMPRELPLHDQKSGKDNIIIDHTFIDNDIENENDDLFVDDGDILYDLPVEPKPVMSNDIISPAAWSSWSVWVKAGTSSKVRVRTCHADGRQVSDVACEGVKLQFKSCDSTSGRCGKPKNVTSFALGECTEEPYRKIPQDSFVKAPPPPPRVPDAPPPLEFRPGPDECFYSLYDNFRQKFVFTRWNLTALITKSKVKRWCDKKSGQYIVMATPLEHCRRYYKDLCKVTQRCRASKPATEAGDFAEGCWRNHVYGERLPVGLSNKNMRTYFICQRFAPTGRAGMTFGYKHTYYTTLYDINLRAPVMSLVKVTSLGDDIWPETDYFIEHGLVENDANMMWVFQKPKKGMLTLSDLDRCHDDQGCDVGLRQVLPRDYHNYLAEEQYTPTHLVWPDLMPFDPSHRLATFTLTNMAPMLMSLFKEWHAMVLKIRKFALEECQIPYNLDLNIKHPGQLSTHRTHKSALYIASGVLPNLDPIMKTGRDVHVPFLFWMSGCCVQHHAPRGPAQTASSNNNTNNNNNNDRNNNDVSMSWEDDPIQRGSKTNVSSFAVYIRNIKGSHVIAAPVLQLEMLLQDMYKIEKDLDDVTLFPGHDSICNELTHDVSPWFQK